MRKTYGVTNSKLQGDRSKRISSKERQNANILALVQLFQEEEERQVMIKIAELQKKAAREEADNLESMPDWKSRVLEYPKTMSFENKVYYDKYFVAKKSEDESKFKDSNALGLGWLPGQPEFKTVIDSCVIDGRGGSEGLKLSCCRNIKIQNSQFFWR